MAAAGDEVVVELRDTGRGIEPDLLPRVFDLFVQGTQGPERSSGGLGLGLALVKRLVALHGGRVEARSDGLGKGSTFIVALPAASRHVAASTPQAGVPTVVAAAARHGHRILIVDDNQD